MKSKEIKELYADNITIYDFYPELQAACLMTKPKLFDFQYRERFVYVHKDGGFCIGYRPIPSRDPNTCCMTQLTAKMVSEKKGIHIYYYFEKENLRFKIYLCSTILMFVGAALLLIPAIISIFRGMIIPVGTGVWELGAVLLMASLSFADGLRIKEYQKKG